MFFYLLSLIFLKRKTFAYILIDLIFKKKRKNIALEYFISLQSAFRLLEKVKNLRVRAKTFFKYHAYNLNEHVLIFTVCFFYAVDIRTVNVSEMPL